MDIPTLLQQADQARRGRWGQSFAVGLLALLLGVGYNPYDLLYQTLNFFLADGLLFTAVEALHIPLPPFSPAVSRVFTVLSIAIIIYRLLIFFLAPWLELGYCRYNLQLLAGSAAKPGRLLFGQITLFLRALVMRILRNLLLLLWSLLLLAPGIIAAYSYALAPYLLVEQPELGPLEAISRSKQLMDGHKLELFRLHLRFAAWFALALLTFNLAYPFFQPRLAAATAAFYRQVKAQSAKRPPGVQMPGQLLA